ncbi:MAG: hypothetical protein QOE68_4319 [Thermoanaerobaculia bacterium]|jgi:hypothetical protein|nr:hypothetical protein [Thermoanaerobaculia bacterium]
MSWSFNTGDRYHTQDTSYYCGAACAMMTLAEIGVPYTSLDQIDLYDSNHAHNVQSSWYTDPYGLCYTLNDRRPASFLPNFFVVHKRLTEAEGTRDVAFTLYHYKVSPSVLVYNCAHWNVVCGVQTDVDPATGPYVVEGFWLNNPVWDFLITSHDATDTCGSGGFNGIGNEFVTYSEWQTNRFNGCVYDAPSTQWISVCDPEPATIELPRKRETRYRGDGRTLIDPKLVAGIAEEGLAEYGLAESKLASRALRNGRVSEPVLVQRLDRPNDFYYLSRWEQDGRISAMIDVDARLGVFKSVRVLDEPAREDWAIGRHAKSIQEAVLSRITDHTFDLHDEKGRFRIYPEAICIPRALVWKPCRESWSPHLPFYYVVAGPHALYVRIDGQVFTHLTSGRGA